MAPRRTPSLHLGLAARLKEARQALGESTTSLSGAAGLAPNTVWVLENEDRVPGLDVVERLARVLGLSPCFLAYAIPGPQSDSAELRASGVGARLRSARDQVGLPRSALGERADITGQSVANIEASEQMPSIATAERLASALGVSPCWLAFGDGPTGLSTVPDRKGPMHLSEAETRRQLIDPKLYERGWTEDHIKREATLGAIVIQGGAPRRAAGRADYVLRIRLGPSTQPIPVALIEAKREGLPPGHGLEQARTYARDCERHHVPFVFSTNGHVFIEYNRSSGKTSEPQNLSEFPTPAELRARYERLVGFSLEDEAAKALLSPYPGGEGQRRYYQDAAIRAVLERVARCRQQGTPARALLSLATGAGKTFIAVHLLRRCADAGQLQRALFVCDRDELRTQALKAFQAVFGSDAQEVYEDASGRNNAKNARIHIATYHTLGIDKEGDASFLTRHYPPGSFSHIVIDECHRSAWNKWSAVLVRNPEAVQIGLTATPRRLEVEEDTPEVLEDRSITANNVTYFGEAAYEYSLAQAMEDGYLAACQIELLQVNLDATGVTAAEVILRNPVDANTGTPLSARQLSDYYRRHDFETKLLVKERVLAMCKDLFDRLLRSDEDRGPEQKTIIFCARDRHADEVADALNNLYADYCSAQGKERADPFAFKCTGESGGNKLVADLRGAARSHFIATTVDLLTTGVDVPGVRNIVFFRYLKSPISFHQMLGRGTRVDERTDKLSFTIYDYTAVTRLFTQEFVTRRRAAEEQEPLGAREGQTDYGQRRQKVVPVVRVDGFEVQVGGLGRYIVTSVEGRAMPMALEDYRRGLAERLLKECKTVEALRARWVAPTERQELLDVLVQAGYSPSVLRLVQDMNAYDLYDVLADLGYGVTPRTRADRASAFDYKHRAWLQAMPVAAATTLRAIARQFEPDGIEGLENPRVWQLPTVRRAGGQRELRALGEPREFLRQLKERLLSA